MHCWESRSWASICSLSCSARRWARQASSRADCSRLNCDSCIHTLSSSSPSSTCRWTVVSSCGRFIRSQFITVNSFQSAENNWRLVRLLQVLFVVCAMDDNNDMQHMRYWTLYELLKLVLLSMKNPLSYMVALSTGGIDKTMLDKSLGDVASFKQWNVLQRLRQLAITWFH